MDLSIDIAILYAVLILASLTLSGWLLKLALKDLARTRRTLGELKTLREARPRRAALRRETGEE